MKELRVFTDGGSRGNPGPSATGVYMEDESHNKIVEIGNFLGVATNNIAEYRAVIDALSWISENKPILSPDTQIKFFMDSNLAYSQIKGFFKLKNPNLKILMQEIRKKEAEIGRPIEWNHVPRELNKMADRMVNVTLDNNTHLF